MFVVIYNHPNTDAKSKAVTYESVTGRVLVWSFITIGNRNELVAWRQTMSLLFGFQNLPAPAMKIPKAA